MRARHHLITGGLGALGAPLVRRLVADGHRVRVLDDGSRGSAHRLADIRDRIELLDGDVRDARLVRRAVRDTDTVWHLAFINGTEAFYRSPERVLDVGVKGAINVIEGCIEAGVGEFFLASSSEVYQTPPYVPTDEAVPLTIPDPFNPRYSYAGGKIISELMAIHYGKAFFRRVVIFRPHNVFGPDMGEDHVVPQLIARLLELASEYAEEVPLPIQGDGRQSRSFVHIDDFVDGLLVLFTRGEHLNIYNVGTTEELSIGDLAGRIGRCLDRRVRLVPGRPAEGGTFRRCPDVRKLQALGFRPRVPFDRGLAETVAWYAARTASRPGRRTG